MSKMNEHTEKHDLVLEFNVDDINPQVIPVLLENLMDAGASDAFVTPVIMKKGRPGFLFTVTCCQSKETKILRVIFRDSSTIGIRKTQTEGVKLERKVYKTLTTHGLIQVKEIIMPDGDAKIIPEFEECVMISKRDNISAGEVQSLLLDELNPNKKVLKEN